MTAPRLVSVPRDRDGSTTRPQGGSELQGDDDDLDAAPAAIRTILVQEPNPVLAEALCLVLRADPFLSRFQIGAVTEHDLPAVLKAEPDILIVNPWQIARTRELALEPFRVTPSKSFVMCYCSDLSALEITQLIELGFRGIVPTTASGDELVRIVSSIAFGGTYIADIYKKKSTSLQMSPSSPPVGDALTDREAEVLHRVALGNSLKEVASALNISTKTVDTYKTRASRKLDLHSRSDIVRYAIASGWMS